MHGWIWFALGIFPTGFCIFHPQGRKYTIQTLVWILNKFENFMKKTEGKEDDDE